MGIYLVVLLVSCAINGFVAKTLAANKGYEGYFWIGFLLGVAGIA